MTAISVGSLGGTIATRRPPGGGAATPALSAAALVEAAPGLAEIGPVRAETVRQVASPSLSFEDVLVARDWALREVEAGAEGVVLTTGTDTLEEAAYLLDLFWEVEAPLVVTGAMRTADAPGADGPANLLGAARTAATAGSRGRGALVVFNDRIHAARWVAKRDALAVETFVSPDFGPLGRVVEGRPLFLHDGPRRRTLGAPRSAAHRVALVPCALGLGTEALEDAIASGRNAGIVVAGYGAGHVSAAEARVIGAHAAALPIVVASRTGAGRTAAATYGFEGSETDLIAKGAWLAGWLPPAKARVLLWSVIASGAPRETWRERFEGAAAP